VKRGDSSPYMRVLGRDKNARVSSHGLKCFNPNACQTTIKTWRKASFAFILYCSTLFPNATLENTISALCPAMQRMSKFSFS
jgi:hypothetical protein